MAINEKTAGVLVFFAHFVITKEEKDSFGNENANHNPNENGIVETFFGENKTDDEVSK